MKHISILVPEGDCSITNIEGTHQILSRVNDFLEDAGEPPYSAFNWLGRNRRSGPRRGYSAYALMQ